MTTTKQITGKPLLLQRLSQRPTPATASEQDFIDCRESAQFIVKELFEYGWLKAESRDQATEWLRDWLSHYNPATASEPTWDDLELHPSNYPLGKPDSASTGKGRKFANDLSNFIDKNLNKCFHYVPHNTEGDLELVEGCVAATSSVTPATATDTKSQLAKAVDYIGKCPKCGHAWKLHRNISECMGHDCECGESSPLAATPSGGGEKWTIEEYKLADGRSWGVKCGDKWIIKGIWRSEAENLRNAHNATLKPQVGSALDMLCQAEDCTELASGFCAKHTPKK